MTAAINSTGAGKRAYFFFFNVTATTEIYPLSLHDALPIWHARRCVLHGLGILIATQTGRHFQDRKSTRLNYSHAHISYAVFCLKNKTNLREELAPVANLNRTLSDEKVIGSQ